MAFDEPSLNEAIDDVCNRRFAKPESAMNLAHRRLLPCREQRQYDGLRMRYVEIRFMHRLLNRMHGTVQRFEGSGRGGRYGFWIASIAFCHSLCIIREWNEKWPTSASAAAFRAVRSYEMRAIEPVEEEET